MVNASPPEELLDEARGSRRTTAVLAGLLVLAGVVGSGALIHRASADTAAEVARHYVQLIADGHLDEATAQVPPQSWSGYRGPRTSPIEPTTVTIVPDLLTTAAVDGTGTRIQVESVVQRESDDPDLAVIQVRYTMDGERSLAMLRAARVGNAWYRPARWQLRDPLLVPVEITSGDSNAGAEIAGIAVPAHDVAESPADGARIAMYPGSYQVEAPRQRWLASGVTTFEVSHAAAATTDAVDVVVAPLEPTPDVRSAMIERGRAFLDTCRRAEQPVSDCPTASRPDLPAERRPDLRSGLSVLSIEIIGGPDDEPAVLMALNRGDITLCMVMVTLNSEPTYRVLPA